MRAAIQIENNQNQFAPGELVRGRVGWEAAAGVERAELRLFYFSKGRGTRDVEVVEKQEWPALSPPAPQDFSFTLPVGPYSFSGKLISLIWALELVLHPDGHTERIEITLAPDRQEVDLHRYPPPPELADPGKAKKMAQRFTHSGG